ncbi:hypothetical protein D3C81_1288270 [compost metagenome]
MRVTPQHIRRCHDDLAGEVVPHTGIGNRHPRTACPRAVAHCNRAVGGARGGLAVHFHPERARQQREGGRQQCISACRQPWHAAAQGDLLTDARIDRSRFPQYRCVCTLIARDNGVHRVAGQPRQTERSIAGITHQWTEPRIGGATATGDKPGTAQISAARQVDQRAGLHIHVLRAQAHPGAVATDAFQYDRRAVVKVFDTVGGAAIRHHQTGRTDRRRTPGQQAQFLGFGQQITQTDDAQRRTQNTALIDPAGAHRQRAKHRVRQRCRRRTLASDAQCPMGIGERTLTLIADPDFGRDPARRVDLRGAQIQVPRCPQL